MSRFRKRAFGNPQHTHFWVELRLLQNNARWICDEVWRIKLKNIPLKSNVHKNKACDSVLLC